MAIDVKSQLNHINNILWNTKFSLALDESTVRDSEALLLGYTRFKQNLKFVEEMLFCESFKTTTISRDIYAVITQYFTENRIPISYVISLAADGAPTMMGRQNGVLKFLNNDNPNIMAVHCIIHRENLAAATISCELDQLLKKVISEVNWIKSRSTNERLFKQLCVDIKKFYIRLLLHTRLRWLSKGNCLERFVILYDAILEFVGGREEFQFCKSSKCKALISYVVDICGKLNALNKEQQ